jgi:hypothetical protein
MRNSAVLAGICLLFVTCQAMAGAELLQNAGLSGAAGEMPQGWTLHYFDGLETAGHGEIVNQPEGDGNSLMLEWQSGAAMFAAQAKLASPLKTGQTYELTGRVKTDEAGRAAFRAESFSADGTLLAEQESVPLSGDGWQDMAVVFTVPADTAKTNIYCLNSGKGKAYFSTLSLHETAAKKEESFPLSALAIPADGNARLFGGKPVFHTFVDSPCPLGFHFWGDKAASLEAQLILDLPEGVQLTEALYAHSGISEMIEPVMLQLPDVKATRHTLAIPRIINMLQAKPAWNRRVNMVLEPADPAAAAGKSYTVEWRLSVAGKISDTRRFELRFLPPLASTPNPKRFAYRAWTALDIAFLSPEVMGRIARHYEEANMNSWPLLDGDNEHCVGANELYRSRGWKLSKSEATHLITAFVPFAEKLPGVRYAVSDKGVQRYANYLCPTYFNSDPEFKEALTSFLQAKFTRLKLTSNDAVIIDYEPWQPRQWCLCDHCRKHFADMFHLGATPSVADALGKHAEKWREFKLRETDAHVRMVSGIIRNAVPGVTVGIYDYAFPHNDPAVNRRFDSVALNARRIEDAVDFHLLSFYHYNGKAACDLFEVNTNVLKKPAYMFASISRNDAVDGNWTSIDEQLSPAQTSVKLLGAAASGAKGCGFYPGEDIDAAFFVAIDQAMARVAALEDFYLDGARMDRMFSATGDATVIRAHQLGDKLLVTLLNFSAAPVQTTVRMANTGKFQKLDSLYSPEQDLVLAPDSLAKLSRAGLRVSLPAHGARFLILAPAGAEKISFADGAREANE